MAEETGGARRLLSRPSVYSFVQRALGAREVRRAFIDGHVRPLAGERVLDLGCGPGDVLDQMPAVVYTGVDRSARYIAAATARSDERATFICDDLLRTPGPQGPFDAVISIGVLHHLDDADAARMMRLAADALAPGGRLVTIDPGEVPGQPWFTRWLIHRDRGANVRQPEEHGLLARACFEKVTVTVRRDLARIPYAHIILEARDPRPQA